MYVLTRIVWLLSHEGVESDVVDKVPLDGVHVAQIQALVGVGGGQGGGQAQQVPVHRGQLLGGEEEHLHAAGNVNQKSKYPTSKILGM